MHSAERWTATTVDSDSLVRRLTNSDDHDAWNIIVNRYGPAVLGFARRLGLNHQDAEDARQDALSAFVIALRAGRFDRKLGRLRDLLFAITRHKVQDIHRRRFRSREEQLPTTEQTDLFHQIPGDDGLAQAWLQEWQNAVYTQCLYEAKQHFSHDTYTMFYLSAIEGRASADVAARISKSANAVDIATSRVRAFLRQIRPAIEELF